MKTIKIIEPLFLDAEGVKAKIKNGRLQNVHLRQGDLDGACAVYSSIMILIIIGAIKYKDLENNFDKRFSIERLKKELLDTKGMHRDGNHFCDSTDENLKSMLERSFSKLVKVKHIPCENTKIEENIRSYIESDLPVLMSYSYSNTGAHALVAIGIETDKNDKLTKILCLDPEYSTPKFTYWNSVIDLTPYKGKYNYRNISESGECQNIKLEDILIISKK